MQTVNLTPRGFDPSNPKAQENIAASEKAADDIHEVIRQKAEFLREIVEDHFAGIDGLCGALQHYLDKADPANADAVVNDVREQWNRLDREHTDAGERLMRAVAGV